MAVSSPAMPSAPAGQHLETTHTANHVEILAGTGEQGTVEAAANTTTKSTAAAADDKDTEGQSKPTGNLLQSLADI